MKSKLMKYISNNKAFTLIEMMIVLVIISILLLIALPNLETNKNLAMDKGCDATIDLVRAQVYAYEMEKGKPLTNLSDLVTEKYVDTLDCPNGDTLDFDDLNIDR